MKGKDVKIKGVYAGSFDPPTNGHLWMINKGASIFDKLVVAIGINPSKKYTFTIEERIDMLKHITKNLHNIEITHFENEFLVKYANNIGAQFILRGIRDSSDYEYEGSMRSVNEDIEGEITTIFLMPPEKLSKISSSLVKGLVGNNDWERIVSNYIPSYVLKYLKSTRHNKTSTPLDIGKYE
ncbi:MAG: pantetheine-phosphate adenylyltransferase [Candidatus Micrarchaeaceae archaeon]